MDIGKYGYGQRTQMAADTQRESPVVVREAVGHADLGRMAQPAKLVSAERAA